jgi:hypothetical protein
VFVMRYLRILVSLQIIFDKFSVCRELFRLQGNSSVTVLPDKPQVGRDDGVEGECNLSSCVEYLQALYIVSH